MSEPKWTRKVPSEEGMYLRAGDWVERKNPRCHFYSRAFLHLLRLDQNPKEFGWWAKAPEGEAK